MKEIIITKVPFAFAKEITDEFGEFSLLSEYQVRIFPAGFSFTVEDIEFIPLYKDNGVLTGLEFRNQIIANGHIPLDASCAQALVKNKEILTVLKSKWFRDSSLHRNATLHTMNFFGSLFADTAGKEHILSLERNPHAGFYHESPLLKPFEAQDSWFVWNDFALVFKKEFIKKTHI